MTGEFGAIHRIRGALPASPGGDQVWIGDDAAVVSPPRGRLLLAADTVVVGVHADLGLTGLDDLGWKAMASCLSDIAAMGGRPCYALVTVSGPAGTDLDALYRGIADAARHFDCPVVGGDLTNAGDTVVTVTVSGETGDGGAAVLRSGARPGDRIWVTGPLGGSAAGLRLLRQQAVATTAQRDAASLHARPRPQMAAGPAARSAGATAMIDVSDGLSADLAHLADASGVGFRLDAVPVHPAATLEEALGGGEDYALVFCAPASSSGALGAAFAGLAPPIPIGVCVDDGGERSLAGAPLARSGWEHHW